MTLAPLLVALVVAAPPTPEPVAPLWEVSAFARYTYDALVPLPDVELMNTVEQLRGRLFLDDMTTVIEIGADLELAVRFATAVQILESRPIASGPSGRAIRQAARTAAYLLHATGHAYETDDDVKASVEAMLPPPTRGSDGHNDPHRAAIEALIGTVRGLRAYGNAWWPHALAAARAGEDDAASLVQEGRWHLREGRPFDAADRLTRALALAPTERTALAAYEALLTADDAQADALADELRAKLIDRWPLLAGRLAARREEAEDRRATRAFEAAGRAVALGPGVVQIERYARMGRPGAADLLAQDLLQRFPDEPRAWHARAEVLHQLGRMESLRLLFADAEARGRFDARLREIRVAARVRLRVEAAMGAARHPLADGDLEGDLQALVAARGVDGEHIAWAARVFLAVAGWLGGAGPERDVRLAEAERALGELVRARPEDPEALRLAIVGWAGLDQAARGVEIVAPLAAKLAPEIGHSVWFLLARVEAGLALRERDPARMKRALVRFDRLATAIKREPAGFERATWRLAWTSAKLGAAALEAKPVPKKLIAEARKELDDLAFDEATHDGRVLAQARLLTLGALADLAGRTTGESGAIDLYRAARAARRDGELALLAGGLVQAGLGDGQGALEFWERALGQATKPGLRQWLFTAAAAAATAVQPERATALRAEALALWDAARVPLTLPRGTLRPLFVGDFDVAFPVVHGEPLALALRTSPVIVLLPELATAKADVIASPP